MTFRLFLDLVRFALTSRDYNEFVEGIKRLEDYDESLTSTGILFSVWLYSVDRSCRKLRELTGWSRAKFCREYGLPVRTVENWELKNTHPGTAMLDLLAFAVMSDLHSVPKANQTEEEKEGQE